MGGSYPAPWSVRSDMNRTVSFRTSTPATPSREGISRLYFSWNAL